jgi:hypothetical protein
MRAAAREMKRKEKLQSDNPQCLFCGFSHWESLIPVTLRWLIEERGFPVDLLELHHVLGAAHDPDLTVPLCRNCHGLVTEDLRRGEISMRTASDVQTRVITKLNAFAQFLERSAISLRVSAEELQKSKDNENE